MAQLRSEENMRELKSMRIKVYEKPTPELRWRNGILQQNWMLQWRDDETRGAANPQTFEWRDVPIDIGHEEHRAERELPGFYDSEARTECYVDGDEINVVVPSDISITVDQAEAFGKALLECAAWVRGMRRRASSQS
jgi:hypothetical protein